MPPIVITLQDVFALILLALFLLIGIAYGFTLLVYRIQDWWIKRRKR